MLEHFLAFSDEVFVRVGRGFLNVLIASVGPSWHVGLIPNSGRIAARQRTDASGQQPTISSPIGERRIVVGFIWETCRLIKSGPLPSRGPGRRCICQYPHDEWRDRPWRLILGNAFAVP